MATKKAENTETKSLNLIQKLAEITLNLGNVPKKGYNAFHKYNYVLEADIIEALRKELAVRNIMLLPNMTNVQKDGEITTVEIQYDFVDGDSFDPETGTYKDVVTVSFGGQGADKGDKGIYKAFTGSEKYALMKTFLISTNDDPESDTSVDVRNDAMNTGEVPPSDEGFVVSATYNGIKEGKSKKGSKYKYFSFTAHGKTDLEVQMFMNNFTEEDILGMIGSSAPKCKVRLQKNGQFYEIKEILKLEG